MIMDEFPDFFNTLKKKVFYEYVNNIRRPLIEFKKKDIIHFDQRADFQ